VAGKRTSFSLKNSIPKRSKMLLSAWEKGSVESELKFTVSGKAGKGRRLSSKGNCFDSERREEFRGKKSSGEGNRSWVVQPCREGCQEHGLGGQRGGDRLNKRRKRESNCGSVHRRWGGRGEQKGLGRGANNWRKQKQEVEQRGNKPS